VTGKELGLKIVVTSERFKVGAFSENPAQRRPDPVRVNAERGCFAEKSPTRLRVNGRGWDSTNTGENSRK
jgi:hypothetical protein